MKPDYPVTAHHLAGLATLESTVEIAAGLLVATYPDIRLHATCHGEPTAVTTARAPEFITDLAKCSRFLDAETRPRVHKSWDHASWGRS